MEMKEEVKNRRVENLRVDSNNWKQSCLCYSSTRIYVFLEFFREFSHPDWLPGWGIQRGISTFESEALRDISLEGQ